MGILVNRPVDAGCGDTQVIMERFRTESEMESIVEKGLVSARFPSQQVNSHRVFAVPQSEIDEQIVRRWHALA